MPSRVLMISTNRELAPQPVLPAGAAWVAQALHLAGFEIRFLDLCFEKNPGRSIDRAVATFDPDGIGMSLRNLDNCDFLSPKSYLSEVRQWADRLKQATDAPILVGGAGVGIMPMQVLEFLDLDYAVAGEGEEAAVRFFRSGTHDRGESIPGLVRRGKLSNGSKPNGIDPNSVDPQLHRWGDTRRYLRYEPVIPVQGKRGCANACLYCTYNTIEGKEWRPRDPARVVDELSTAMRMTGASDFEFVDSVFNQPEGYMETLLEEVIRKNLRARLHISSLSPKGLTAEQIRLMERSGIVSAVVTPESASDESLAALCKGFTADDVERAADLLAGSTIRALWCFLLGGPGEDEKTLATSIRFINRRVKGKQSAYITTGIRIYPGTGLHRVAIAEGVVEPEQNLLMPHFYFTPRLSVQQTFMMLRTRLENSERCIFPSDTRLGALPFFRRIASKLKLPTPFWRYSGLMNRMLGGSRIVHRNGSNLAP